MPVSLPIDYTSNLGKVRAIVPDVGPDFFFFQDEQLNAFLSIESNAVRLAAAMAVETQATDIAMVDKVIETLDLKTDGAKVMDALLNRAKMLRQQYEDCDLNTFDIIEYGDLTIDNRLEYFFKTGEIVITDDDLFPVFP